MINSCIIIVTIIFPSYSVLLDCLHLNLRVLFYFEFFFFNQFSTPSHSAAGSAVQLPAGLNYKSGGKLCDYMSMFSSVLTIHTTQPSIFLAALSRNMTCLQLKIHEEENQQKDLQKWGWEWHNWCNDEGRWFGQLVFPAALTSECKVTMTMWFNILATALVASLKQHAERNHFKYGKRTKQGKNVCS